MITGDNILTAANVSTQLEMGPPAVSLISWTQEEIKEFTNDSVEFELSNVKGEKVKTISAVELIDDEWKIAHIEATSEWESSAAGL